MSKIQTKLTVMVRKITVYSELFVFWSVAVLLIIE